MNWKSVRLGDAATFVNGYAFKPSDWGSVGKEIIRIQNLTGSSKEKNYFAGSAPSKYHVRAGDLLISWSATLGIYEWNQEDAWLNQHIFKVVFDKLDFDKGFFRHLMGQLLETMGRAVHGSTMKHITKKRFDNIQILYPSLEEQKQIATILDAADELRQKDKALISKYDELTQSLFLDIFGDLDGNIKYPIGKVGDLVTHVKDGPHVSPKYVENGFPIFSTRNIRPFELIEGDVKYVSADTYKDLTKRFKPRKGDVLLTKGGTTGYAKIVDWDWDFCIWVHLAAIRVDQDKASPKYLEAALNSHYCYQQSQQFTRGIANKDLGLTRMVKIKLPIPPIARQTQFAKRVQAIESQKAIAQEGFNKSEQLFSSLLQKAFKGELTN
jgi:type I restriction enzyme, S subunit